MIVVYTSVFGKTDPLHTPAFRGNCRYVCLTDQRDLQSDFWEIIRLPKMETPNRESRVAKALPPFPGDITAWLWIDANFVLKIDPWEIYAKHPEPIVNFEHRDRKRIKDEAEEIIRLGKALPATTRRQLAAYQAEGFDTDDNPMTSLSNNGVLFRRNTPEVRKFNRLLLKQLRTYTLRDQMAVDYCAWKLGIRIGKFPGNFKNNHIADYHHFERPVNDH